MTEELEIEISEDILVEADRYSIDANINEGLMRISFLNEDGVLSTMTTDSDGAYHLAHQILRGYDKLEGL
jgi:hypothetical protein